MKLKINNRVVLGISIPLLVILLIVGLGVTYRSGTIHGQQDDTVMPWEHQITMEGTDYFQYFFNAVKGAYVRYPWVVQVSYIIVVLCILAVGVLAVFMSWDIYMRKKNARRFDELKSKYYGVLSDIAKADRVLERSEIYAMLRPEQVTETSYVYRIKWIELFILLRADTDMQEPAITNMRNAMEVLGLSEFMENRLIYGRDKDKLRVIQAARLLDMQLPDSVMASIVNNRDVRLHKAARFYYMLINKDDPYLFFENDKMNDRFSVWDKLEFHQLFADCHEAGKKLPSFIPLIRQLSNPEKAAFEGMGLRRFVAAEEKMKACFYNQSESIKRVILESILSIRSGKSATFIKEVFDTSASRFTKRTALYCLWYYGDAGKELFMEMKKTASEDDLVLFNQVERTSDQEPSRSYLPV